MAFTAKMLGLSMRLVTTVNKVGVSICLGIIANKLGLSTLSICMAIYIMDKIGLFPFWHMAIAWDTTKG